jgi:outer membrane receptor protein involved in Fe transport
MKFKTIFILLAMFAVTGYAQQRAGARGKMSRENMPKVTLKGNVIDADTKRFVEYANVVLYRMRDSSLVTGAMTDGKGHFTLKNVTYGKYYLVADFLGYHKTTIKNITIKPGSQPANLKDIAIKQSTIAMDAVEVVGEKAVVEYRIDKKVVNVDKNIAANGGTAADALQNTPAVDTDIEGNVTLRGSSSFTVLIDGKPSILEGSDALNQIPANAIENIEIITNPSAKHDPDGTAGIVNIVTKRNKLEGLTGMVNASYGTGPDYGGSAQLSYRTEKLTLSTEFNYRSGDKNFNGNEYRYNGTDNIKSTSDGGRTRSFSSFKLGADYLLSDKNTIGLIGGYNNFSIERKSDAEYRKWMTGNDLYANTFNTSLVDLEVPSYSITLTDEHKFGKDHKLLTTFYYRRSELDKKDGSSVNNILGGIPVGNDVTSKQDNTQTDARNGLRFEIDYERPVGEKGKVEAGYNLRVDNADIDNNSIINNQGNPTVTELSNYEFDRSIHALYATYSTQLSKLDVKLGLRGEYTNRLLTTSDNKEYDFSKVALYPSAYFTYNISKKQQVQVNYSRRVNRPRDHFLNPLVFRSDGESSFQGNPDLEPEYANSFELNYQYRFGASFISLEGYYRKIDNKMFRFQETVGSKVVSTIKNLNSDQRLGIELMGMAKLFRWWSLTPSATFYYSRLEENTIVESNSWNARLSNTFRLPTQTSLQIDGRYSAPRSTLYGENAESYFVNVAVRQGLFKNKASVTFSIYDVFNTRKRESFSVPPGGYTIDSEFFHEAPIYKVSISYRFNNYKRNRGNKGNGGSEMDYGDFM